MPDITFKHSDLTNSRELIYKLNNLTPPQGEVNGLYVVTCEYNGEEILNLSPNSLTAITDKISEGYDVCVKMHVTSGIPYDEYLILSDIIPNIPSLVFTSALNRSSSAPEYYYRLTITDNVNPTSIEKVELTSVEYFSATYDESEGSFSTTVTLQDITTSVSKGRLPVLKVYYTDDDVYVYYNRCNNDSFTGPVYFETSSGTSYFKYNIVQFETGGTYIFDINSVVLTTNNTYTEVTYSELIALIENDNLTKGCKYCITDYVTTTNAYSSSIKSGNHPFMLVVTATSESQLSHDAYAVPVSGNTYFQYCDLSKWKISYDYNNNTSKYFWANSTNGKGVIYNMTDEYGNKCPYDFKNIMFKRWRVDSSHFLADSDTTPYKDYAWNAADDFIWSPTFGVLTGEEESGTELEDSTVQQVSKFTNNDICADTFNNTVPNIVLFAHNSDIYTVTANVFTKCSNITLVGTSISNIFTNVSNTITESAFLYNTLTNITNCNISRNFESNICYNLNNVNIGIYLRYNNIVNCNYTVIMHGYNNCSFSNCKNSTFNYAYAEPTYNYLINNQIKNVNVKNISSYTLTAADAANLIGLSYETIISTSSDGVTKIYCLADLIK